jgi:hypothetical protein
LCRTYGSLRKSDKAAASYGKKVESGKLKVESGGEWRVESGKGKIESEEFNKDKATAVQAVAIAHSNATRGVIEARGWGIVKEPLKAERARTLQGKKENRQIRGIP